MLDDVLHRSLPVDIAHARQVGHHVVVRQRGDIHQVEFKLVQESLEDDFLAVVQNDVLRPASKVATGYVQLGLHSSGPHLE